MEVLMFGLFKKSKVIRKSDDQSNKTETKWFKGQKVKIKTGTTSSRPNKKNYRGNKSNRSNNQTWFKEAPLPVPNVEKKQMLIVPKEVALKLQYLREHLWLNIILIRIKNNHWLEIFI